MSLLYIHVHVYILNQVHTLTLLFLCQRIFSQSVSVSPTRAKFFTSFLQKVLSAFPSSFPLNLKYLTVTVNGANYEAPINIIFPFSDLFLTLCSKRIKSLHF